MKSDEVGISRMAYKSQQGQIVKLLLNIGLPVLSEILAPHFYLFSSRSDERSTSRSDIA